MRVTAFLAARLSRGGALGLSLTISVIAIVLAGWTFGELADQVIERDDLAGRDDHITDWLVDRRTDWLTTTLRVATNLGGFFFAVPLVVITALAVPHRWGRWRTAAVMATVMIGTSLIVNAIKLLIARPRPTLADVVATATGYAFPSGHSAQAMAAYTALAYLLTPQVRRRAWRLAVWAAAGVVIIVVGFSRLYLGVHWLTDVFGGYAIGALWTMTVLTAVRAAGELRTIVAARRVRAGPPTG